MKKGFTLIELLVVIAIIGILAVVVTVNLNSARQKARDAKRKSDLANIQTALAMYKDKNDVYPKEGEGWCTYISNPGQTYGEDDVKEALVPEFLSTLPTDPQKPNQVGDYYYSTLDAGTGYHLAANMELEQRDSWSTDPCQPVVDYNYHIQVQ